MSCFAWVGAPEFEGDAERWGRNSQRHCGIDESSEGGNEELSLCPRTHWAGREGRYFVCLVELVDKRPWFWIEGKGRG